jgi:hypothetical protein
MGVVTDLHLRKTPACPDCSPLARWSCDPLQIPLDLPDDVAQDVLDIVSARRHVKVHNILHAPKESVGRNCKVVSVRGTLS